MTITEKMIDTLEEEKDEVYRQRNYLVAALAHLFPSGIRPTDIEGWDPDWHNCVYIDLPAGQVSYHYHNREGHLFADLPPYEKPYDGHDKEQVHERLMSLRRPPALIVPPGSFDDVDFSRVAPGHITYIDA